MAASTHFAATKQRPRQGRLPGAVVLGILALSLWSALPARAEEATLMAAAITRDEPGERPGLFVADHYEFKLPQPLIDALHRGIALYFTHEFAVTKTRWYWLDKPIIESTFTVRLAFNPLTRRYQVAYNGLSLGFDTLEQALPFIKSLRRWRVGPNDIITSTSDCEASIRFYLDASKLPKPMQVTNHDSVDWTVESDWTTLSIPPEVVDEQEH